MISALKNEKWLDHNTRAVAIIWTVTCAWTNANFMITLLIENPGNNVFLTSYKIQTIYLSIGNEATLSYQNEDVLSIIIDVAMIINVILFGGKNVVELSIGINRITNIVEGLNLALLLFAIFDTFTLVGLTNLKSYKPFTALS
jgi:hypothetical protein